MAKAGSKKTEVAQTSIDDLIPYEKNARDNNELAVEKVAESISEFGFNQPIVVDKDNVIIAGHTRFKAAQQLGLKKVPVLKADHLSKEQADAYRLADNRTAQESKWIESLLTEELLALQEADFDLSKTGFDESELSALLAESLDREGFTDQDETPEPQPDPVSARGDIWLVGESRIMCGDSTSAADVTSLMDGKLADVVFTDPPYNTGMTAQTQAGSGGLWKGKGEKARLSHMFDDRYTDEEWQQFMSDFCQMYYAFMKDNTAAYICLDWRRNYELIPHIKSHFDLSNTIVWDKVVHGLGSDYKYTYELINVCKKGKPELDTHQGDREYSDVWHIQRKMGKNKDHATAKPVELVARCLRHASKPNALCLDLFMGSGTTLIAAESTNRICYGMELSESYCDVIVTRWQNFTGKQAIHAESGKTFDEIKSVNAAA